VVHAFCVLAFVALPFFNVVRFDIPRQRFYFAGYELWIGEFSIVFFSLMFLMFLVVVSSVFYGRVYCGYLCPQMIFSEASLSVESYLRRKVDKKLFHFKPKVRARIARALWLAVVAVGSVFAAFVFMTYFIEPRDLLHRLLSFDLRTSGGLSGAVVTLVAMADFSLVRLRFCTSVCPYGYLQGMLGDGDTLLVRYSDPRGDCIECKKCVRVCPMGIDIRESPFQIECVHCAECIDACEEVLVRLGKAGLIQYAWGDKDQPAVRGWRRRLGIHDAKRVIALLVLLAYASGLFVALSMRHAVLVRISPERGEKLYRIGADGRVSNQFRYRIDNRSRRGEAVAFRIQGLQDAALAMASNPVALKPGESVQGEFEISRPAARRGEMVAHFKILANTEPFDMTFLEPAEEK
jgi:cytochrome c oxidase accessory protein FixG